MENKVENVEETVETVKSYTQEQVDQICDKVRSGAVKNWVAANFGDGVSADDVIGKVKNLESEIGEIRSGVVKSAFEKDFGGRSEAFDMLKQIKPELFEKGANTNLLLSELKRNKPFLFHKDETTIVNLNKDAVKRNFSYENKEYFDGSNLNINKIK